MLRRFGDKLLTIKGQLYALVLLVCVALVALF